jgi:TatA/E family protein of Tat protein translocase
MLSLPHLVVLFVVALVIFGPQKLPELARMLGKATAEFRKMTNDFRFALEDEVRELERQTRIREEETAAAARAAQAPPPAPSVVPEGAVPRESSASTGEVTAPAPSAAPAEPQSEAGVPSHGNSILPPDRPAEALSVPHDKSSEDNTVV